MKSLPKFSKNFPNLEFEIEGEAEFALVTDESMPILIEFLESQAIVAVDTETKSPINALDPLQSKIRLIQIGFPLAHQAVIVDCDVVDGRPLVDALCRPGLLKVFHNKKFDRKMFFSTFGVWLPECECTFVMSLEIAMGAGYKNLQERGHSFAALAKAFFNVDLDKTLQASEWAGPLTEQQLEYAALDVGGVIGSNRSLLLRLHEVLRKALTSEFPNEHGWGMGSETINPLSLDQEVEDVLAEVEYFGVPIAPEVIGQMQKVAHVQQQELLEKLCEAMNIPRQRNPFSGEIELSNEIKRLFNSPKALVRHLNPFLPEPLSNTRSEYLESILEDIKGLEDFDFGIQLINDLLKYKELTKLLQFDYRRHVHHVDGCLHGEFIPIGTSTGRLSSRSSGKEKLNVQQISSLPLEIEIEADDLWQCSFPI